MMSAGLGQYLTSSSASTSLISPRWSGALTSIEFVLEVWPESTPSVSNDYDT